MDYKVNELFVTIQGEGIFTGVPSIFVRLQGCPVGCAWCDTKHTWDVDLANQIEFKDLTTKNKLEQWSNMTAGEILDYAISIAPNVKHVVITGGEPCMYDLNPLTQAFEGQNYQCQIETSGTFEIKTTAKTWVTLSPKIDMKGGYKILPQALKRADEIKYVVATEHDLFLLDQLLASDESTKNKPILLQPNSQKERSTQFCIDTCLARNWRLSAQLHKYLEIE